MQEKLELSPELKRLRDSIKMFEQNNPEQIDSRAYREKFFNFIGYCATHDLLFSAKDGYLLFKEMGFNVDEPIFKETWEKGRKEYMESAGIQYTKEFLDKQLLLRLKKYIEDMEEWIKDERGLTTEKYRMPEIYTEILNRLKQYD